MKLAGTRLAELPRPTELHLVGPLLRYGESGGLAPAAGSWELDEAGSWWFGDGVVRLRAELGTMSATGAIGGGACAAARAITLRCVAEREAEIRECAIVLAVRCDEPPWILDRRMCWGALRGRAMSTELTPFVVRWRSSDGPVLELRATGGTPAATLQWERGELRIGVKLDSAALHPRWIFAGHPISTASPRRPAGWEASVSLTLRRAESLESAPVVAGRFPHGAEAAFVITDHCDFDTVGAFRAFLEGGRRGGGWLGKGLRFTKAVFAAESPATVTAEVPTMRHPEYRTLLERLHGDGSEIAPHGINERSNISPELFRAALAEIATAFAPRTWIDHGTTLHYCYSMGGAQNPEYRLTEELRRHGIHTLWAYQDAPIDPVASLNLLALPVGDIGRAALQMGRHLVHGRALVAARYARSMLLEHTGGGVQHRLGRALSVARREYMQRREKGQLLRAAITIPGAVMADMRRTAARGSRSASRESDSFTREEAIHLAPTLYPERAVPLGQLCEEDLLLFATMEVLHTADAYTPAALDRLLAERGLHIAHTYLLNRLPYVAGIFEDADAVELSTAWRTTVERLAEVVASGRLWNPGVGELAQWVCRWQPVSVNQLSERAVEMTNPRGEPVPGYTILLPPDVAAADVRWGERAPAGARGWGRWLGVWGDLPARGSIVVRW